MSKLKEIIKDENFIRLTIFVSFNALLLYILFFAVKNIGKAASLLLAALSALLHALTPVIIGIVLAYILAPLVEWVSSYIHFSSSDDIITDEKLRKRERYLGTAISFILITAALSAVVFGLVFLISGSIRSMDINAVIARLDEKLKLPEGYYYNYGGEFQNLQSATQRLIIVVPVALIIILLLLYATVKNLRESLFVFSAIPLAAIGGVWALWLRGMPFSISAGVGFIALFGVAVLNGIVLIGQMNQIQKQAAAVPEENDASLAAVIQNRIIDSCMIRLRPVLMTALVASMGFLPMALSHGDGAEVQRPLATVVIGGLITSTLLTLLVLPAIYKMFTKK